MSRRCSPTRRLSRAACASTCRQPQDSRVPSIASPLRLSAAPPQYRLPPPALGAHTRAVLSSVLGMDTAHIDELARAGVIYAGASGAASAAHA